VLPNSKNITINVCLIFFRKIGCESRIQRKFEVDHKISGSALERAEDQGGKYRMENNENKKESEPEEWFNSLARLGG
jgi:hypothetical protein